MANALTMLTLMATVLGHLMTAQGDDLKIMSFNIRYGTANDGKDAWPKRHDLVLKTITNYQPDLLGTQETLPFQADFLKQQMADFEYFGWSRDEMANGEQCGIFIRKERFEVLDSGQFWLSETPEVKYSKSWDSSLPRVATWLRLKDKQSDNRELVFANTHFDHRGVEARRNSAALLRQRLAEIASGRPIIVTGDFNCGEGSDPWTELLSGSRLHDSFREFHLKKSDNEGTFHGFTGKPGQERIDWILTTKEFAPDESSIDRTNDNGQFPSDHFPVTSKLSWQK